MTSETNPTRFNHAWAGLILAQFSTIGGHPATKSVARLAPTATSTRAATYPWVTSPRLGPSARPSGRTVAVPVSAIPDDERDAAGDGKADDVGDDAERHAHRTKGDRTDRRRPEPRVARGRGGEGGGEERHHARDRRRRGAGKGEVQRQPGAAADVGGQEARDDRREEEGDGDRDGSEGNQPVRRAIDRSGTATQGGRIDHGAFSISTPYPARRVLPRPGRRPSSCRGSRAGCGSGGHANGRADWR